MSEPDWEELDAKELFHRLWGKAVGTTDYNKKQWCKMEEFVNKGITAIKSLERAK